MWMLHTVHVMYMNVHIDWHAAKSNFEVGPYRYPISSRICIVALSYVGGTMCLGSWACRALEIQAETAMHMSMHMFKSVRFQ